MADLQKLIKKELLKHHTCFPREGENGVRCTCGDKILYATGADPEVAVITHVSYELSYALSYAFVEIGLHKG